MKTKKAMKKITHIGMAALVAMGMLGTSCNKAESPEIETPETQKENIVTLTTTVGFAADGTKALAADGKKNFAAGETMALCYTNTKGDWVKAVSAPLTTGDITNEGKSATFTFTLTNPDKTKNVHYIYPAAIVNQFGNMNEAALFGSQDGTLNTLASTFDYSRKIGAWDGENLPKLTLENQLAILAITLTNADGSSDITSSITGLTLSDGTKTYNVTREAVAGPIYVAIFPTADATITVTATDGTKNYTKTLTGKTYAKGNGYPVGWRMTQEVAEPVAVDLGLSVKWANMNVGASSESDFGKYFAWGETTGYDSSDGHSFAWANYSLCSGSQTTMTKYCNKEGYGTVDNKTTLEAADDAATANWGSPWRMPTKAEMQELADTKSNTADYTWELTTVDGHKGYRITRNSTGANIFLPASGNYGSSLYDQNYYGYYWSSSLDEESGSNPSNSYYLGTNNSNAGVYGWNSRYLGLSVRPVLGDAAPAGPTAYTLAESTVGMIVGSDGKAYAAADKDNLPMGVTVAGLVAYKNGNNGLAIALTDETSKMDWYEAMGNSGAKAHTPAVTGQTWKLPSKDDIVKMLHCYDDYWGDLNGAIVNVGGTGLLDGPETYYWLSDESDEDEDEARYMRDLTPEEPTTAPKDRTYLVRSVIAF